MSVYEDRIALLLIAILLTGCRAKVPGKTETAAVNWTKHHLTVGGRNDKNPVPAIPENIADGKQIFTSYCMVCHGLDGQNTGVPFPVEVVARLRDRHRDILVGLKDSSGDLAYSRELARRLPGFDVFPSSEGSLVELRRSGFAGCISATTNVNGAIARQGWLQPDTEAGRQAVAEAVAIREALGRFPLVASVKWALSDMKRDSAWALPSPPLRALSGIEQAALRVALDATAYRRLVR